MFEQYHQPASLEEALSILGEYSGQARVVAGGTDLILQLFNREISVRALVDLTHIAALRQIGRENELIKIGSLATHTDLATSPLLQKVVPFLAEAAGSVGSLQVRNVGTVGGNIINAQPAADAAVPLMALGAVCKVVSTTGEREVPLTALYRPEGGTTLDPGCEILTEIRFVAPGGKGGAGAFMRLARRKAVTLPVFNTAVVLWPDEEKKRIDTASIVMGPVARIPFKAGAAEKVLVGSPAGEHSFRQAAQVAADEARPRDSRFRGSSLYRKKLTRVMVFRALVKAWDNLKNGGQFYG